MTKFLAGVLSVIAVGVLLIAYGLISPRAAAFDVRGADDRVARPSFASEQILLRDDPASASASGVRYAAPAFAAPAATRGYRPFAAPQAASPIVNDAPEVRTGAAAPRRTSTHTIERAPGRDWKKTAMIIGGSSAAAAGVGAIFGGKKGALIGAAIGGGASTLYETTR